MERDARASAPYQELVSRRVPVACDLGAGPAWACSCIFDPEGVFAKSSMVFLGTKIATEHVIPTDCNDQFLPECHPHDVGISP